MIDGKKEPYELECEEFAAQMTHLSRNHKFIEGWALVCLDAEGLPCVMAHGIRPDSLSNLWQHMADIEPESVTRNIVRETH